jgi:hypothetical protein
VWRIGEIVDYVFASAPDVFEQQWLAQADGWVQVFIKKAAYVFASAREVFERQWLV